MLLILWKSNHLWLRYSKFQIWPWKFNVKIMDKVNPMVTFEAQSSIDMFAFCFVAIGPFWLRYSAFHIWPWKFKVKVTPKINQNLIKQSIGQVHESYQKWKKSEKLFRCYRVDKTLWPPAAAAYEPVQKHIYRGDLKRCDRWMDGRTDRQRDGKDHS